MSAVKERILGAVTVMNDADAAAVWGFIVSKFPNRSWDDIEEVEPDEWDLEMLREIANNPECHEFVSSEEAMKELGLQPWPPAGA